ncbi:3517_t:CDS:2 [Cetraspora pellucida]|uniref:3517_t:CDS:1 n=1 Tax=Cetraspora pellucida TaxID=1433469 RepID=A0A9N9D501_9GLOM|nr:3517_t:CDS:2 [Cetraspora pellucida]
MTNLESKPIGPGDYGFCPACHKPKTDKNWCPECHSKLLLEENPGWTSGDEKLDNYIKKTIIDARRSYDYLEFIPFENFKDIEIIGKGGFATAFSAIRTNCLEGHFTWDVKENKYFRKSYCDYRIALKYFHKIDAEAFLNECMMLQNDRFLQCYGISRNPKTNEFVIVLDYAQEGDLRHFLKDNHNNLKWKDRLNFLTKIAKDLNLLEWYDCVINQEDSNIYREFKIADESVSSDYENKDETEFKSNPENKYSSKFIPYVTKQFDLFIDEESISL